MNKYYITTQALVSF